MSALDEQKKLVMPYLQRAQEVEKADPKIAYYCRMYALDQGLGIDKKVRAPEISGLLGAVMDKLEKDRAVVALGSRQEDGLYCENFALTVFNRADRVDRAGRADKATAMTFYAASYFFDILRQFGDLTPDTEQKQRYAAWRAAEINKAVKEGRPPAPPPAARTDTDEDAQMLDELARLELGGTAGGSTSGSGSADVDGGSGHGSGGGLAGLSASAPLPPQPADVWAGSPGGGAGSGAPPPPPHPQLPPSLPPIVSGGRQDSGGSFDLPSPPKQQPIESPRSSGGSSVWTPPPLRRFQTFQKVLYCPPEGDGVAPVRGTVAKVEEGAHPERPTYLVALPDRIVAVDDAATLAPELATGEVVVYHSPSGHSVEATVAEIDLSHWPPSYLVRQADGSYVDTTDERLQQVHVPRPRSEGAQLSGLGLGTPPPRPPPSAAAAAGGPAAGPGAPPPAPPPAPSGQGGSLYPTHPPPAVSMLPPPPPAPSAPPSAPPAAAPRPHMAHPPAPHPPPSQPPHQLYQPAAAAAAAAAPPPAAAAAAPLVPRPVPGYQPGLVEITEASKLTKSANSALQFEDVTTAVKLLTEALQLLTQPRQ